MQTNLTPPEKLIELEAAAVELLKREEPKEGLPYYLAFSGGKDSCVIKHIAMLSGVKFEAWYANTTIDPPELIRFIKEQHKDVQWRQPKDGSMMARIAVRPGLPPTRSMRWCCAEYKENHGNGRTKIFGVRASESVARRAWKEVSEDTHGNKAICPIVTWTDADVWGYINHKNIAYCKLYDEGWSRLGCVGCPLATKKNQEREFNRWPRYRDNWKRAILANWERYHTRIKRNGEPYYHAKFKSGEDMWQWWLTNKTPDYIRGSCQSGVVMTNEPLAGEEREEDK